MWLLAEQVRERNTIKATNGPMLVLMRRMRQTSQWIHHHLQRHLLAHFRIAPFFPITQLLFFSISSEQKFDPP